jgi:hypothetical protein
VRDAAGIALLPLMPDPVSGRVDKTLEKPAKKRSPGAGDNEAVFHVSKASLGDLEDDTLLCVLRHLPPHHRAIARLACRRLNMLVGPVSSQRLPLKPLLNERPLPCACVWEAVLMLDTRINLHQQSRIAAAVAASGELELLLLLKLRGCKWNTETCSQAAGGGHLEVLQWARANGCNWNSDTCAYAAAGGHLEVLQWARANGCDWDSRTCGRAAAGGHLEVFQWARANGCD